MLKDMEVKRLIEAIGDYRELIEQSSDMRDKLDALHKGWAGLRQEREQLRASFDGLHEDMSQMKVDYQGLMKRANDVAGTEDTILDNIKFLLDELTSLLKKHEITT